MIRDVDCVNLSGTIFWSKLDEKENYSMLRLGIDVGEGVYNRMFCTVSNPNEKAYKFVKKDNQVVLLGAWLDMWNKDDGTSDLQIKAYDSNVQFYLPGVRIPRLNDVTLYGKALSYNEGDVVIETLGGRNPSTGEYAKRSISVHIGDGYGDVTAKKIFLKGSMASEAIEGGKSKLKVLVDYDQITLMG